MADAGDTLFNFTLEGDRRIEFTILDR